MKTAIKTAAILASIFSLTLVAGAEEGKRQGDRDGKKRQGQECNKGDANGDRQGRREQVLKRFDKDGDGKLSEDERAKARKAHKKHKEEGRGTEA